MFNCEKKEKDIIAIVNESGYCGKQCRVPGLSHVHILQLQKMVCARAHLCVWGGMQGGGVLISLDLSSKL